MSEPQVMTAARERMWVGAILALTLLVYAKSLGNGFAYDDAHYVKAYTMHGPNVMVLEDRPLGEYFERPMGYGVQRTGRGFRPVTVLSYAWTHHAFRTPLAEPGPPEFPESSIRPEFEDPAWPHHLLNVLLHLLATFLAYLLLRVFTGPGLAALGGAAVFALHALRSDQVISIVGRGELLPFVFGATACLVFLRAVRTDAAGAKWSLVGATAVCAMIAFLSKESAVGWVGVVPIYVATLLVRAGSTVRDAVLRQAVPLLIGFVVPLVVFFVLRANMFAKAGVESAFWVSPDNNLVHGLGFFERLPTAVMVWAYGLYKLVVPYPLACDYSRAVFEVVGWSDWRFLLGAAGLLAVTVLGLWALRRAPLVFLGATVFLGFSFITSNVPLTIETLFGERLYYTPGLGLSFVVAALLARSRRVAPVVVAIWLALCAALCVVRCFEWESSSTLFAADADNQPRSLGLQMNMARECRLREDWAGRDHYLDRALAIDPEYSGALNDRAADLLLEGRFAEALPFMKRAARAVVADGTDRASGNQVRTNLGRTYLALGQIEAARAVFEGILAGSLSGPPTQSQNEATVALCFLAWRAQDFDELERRCAAGERRFAEDHQMAVFRALLQSRAGDQDAAATKLEQIVPRLPPLLSTVAGLEGWIEILRARGKLDAATERSLHLAGVLHELRREAEAERVLRTCLGHPRFRLPAYRLLAWVAWSRGAEAVQAVLRDAMAVAPNDAALVVHQGILAQAAGRPEQAARILAQVMPRLPRGRDALRGWVSFAKALHALGDRQSLERLLGELFSVGGMPSEHRRVLNGLAREIGMLPTR